MAWPVSAVLDLRSRRPAQRFCPGLGWRGGVETSKPLGPGVPGSQRHAGQASRLHMVMLLEVMPVEKCLFPQRRGRGGGSAKTRMLASAGPGLVQR